MSMRDERGSAAVEMAVLMPAIAILLLISVQLFLAGAAAMKNLLRAEATIAAVMGEGMSPRSTVPREWPCLEEFPISGGRVGVGGNAVVVGAGKWKIHLNVNQEVVFVTEPICSL